MSLVEEVVDAYGGVDAWRASPPIRLSVRSGGPAFVAKGRPRLPHGFTATVGAEPPWVTLSFAGRAAVRYQLGPDGTTAVAPDGGRRTLDRLRPTLRPWSDLEVAAFCAAAMWTYVAVPFVLLEPSVAATRELPGRRVEVTFRPRVRTHSARQVLHLDDELRIVRHDYTAVAIASWARAAAHVADHVTIGRVLVGGRRVVRPRARDGGVRRGPTLVTVSIAAAGRSEHA